LNRTNELIAAPTRRDADGSINALNRICRRPADMSSKNFEVSEDIHVTECQVWRKRTFANVVLAVTSEQGNSLIQGWRSHGVMLPKSPTATQRVKCIVINGKEREQRSKAPLTSTVKKIENGCEGYSQMVAMTS
jgi:hypothetical protein